MKRLTYLMLALLPMAFYSCRLSQEQRYQRYLEEKDDSTFEYIEQPHEAITDEDAEAVGAITNDDGLIAVPDIPKERPVHMDANDYEVKKAMSGR